MSTRQLTDSSQEITDGYTYDEAGNRTSLITASDTTFYTFDVLNRLETVNDPHDGVTTYTYDAVGNQAGITCPNETVTEYTYNKLNRLRCQVEFDLQKEETLIRWERESNFSLIHTVLFLDPYHFLIEKLKCLSYIILVCLSCRKLERRRWVFHLIVCYMK